MVCRVNVLFLGKYKVNDVISSKKKRGYVAGEERPMCLRKESPCLSIFLKGTRGTTGASTSN
jgi:hypothetical protein